MGGNFLQVNDGMLHYEVWGDGPAIVLIHAGYVDSRMWEGEVQYLSGSYKVITYDVRGFGESSRPDSEYSDSEDLRELMDFLGIRQAIVIGISNGGRIAFDFSVEHPERVRGIIAINAGIRGIGDELNGDGKDLWGDLDGIEEKYSAFIESGHFRDAAALDVDYWSHMLMGSMREKVLDMAEQNVSVPETSPDKYQRSPEPPAYTRLESLKCPVLIVSSDNDREGMRQISRLINTKIHGSRLVALKNADHIPPFSSPEELKTAILGFVKEIEQ